MEEQFIANSSLDLKMQYHQRWKEVRKRLTDNSVVKKYIKLEEDRIAAEKAEELRKLKEEQEQKEKERRILEAISNRRRDYLVVDSTYMDDPEMVKTLDEEKLFWKMAHQYIVGNSIPDTLRRIVAEVCLKHQIRLIEVLSDRRTSNIIPIRFEMIYRIKSETTWSLPRIGRFMGGRDHTTILHACRTFQKWIDEGKVKL